MKRKARKKGPVYTPLEIRAEPQAAIPPARTLQNIHITRVIVRASTTPTGKRYEFLPGQKQPVNDADADYLLSLEHGQAESGCCGGQTVPAKYFTEV